LTRRAALKLPRTKVYTRTDRYAGWIADVLAGRDFQCACLGRDPCASLAPGAARVYRVGFAAVVPMARSDFDDAAQARFREAVVEAAGGGDVEAEITGITEVGTARRARRAAGLQIAWQLSALSSAGIDQASCAALPRLHPPPSASRRLPRRLLPLPPPPRPAPRARARGVTRAARVAASG
jgi:hypothetical protein